MASDQEIYEMLTGAATSAGPCGGCGDAAAGGNLAAELESALDALGGSAAGGEIDTSAIDEGLLFGDAGAQSTVTLEDLIALAEQYPGLKITLSF